MAAALSKTSGAASADEIAIVPGYWARRPGFPPEAISDPSEWSGQPYVHVICTQTGLPPRQQKQLVKKWCDALPSMTAVKILWFGSRVSQELFDAACEMPNIESLYLKWNGVKDLSPIASLERLRHLHLGASTSVQSLIPLAGLGSLQWLQIESSLRHFSLEPLQGLSHLEGLGFLGVEGKQHSLPSLAPLSALQQLRWLHLGSVHVSDGSLRPLAALKKLEWLGIGNFFELEEFAWLSTRLPSTKCDWLKPFCRFHPSVFPCRKCKANWCVMTSGKGSRLLCPSCDTLELAKHVMAFTAAADSAAEDAG